MDTSDEIEKLKDLRKNVNWEDEEKRKEFFCQLAPLISNWKGPLPNLKDIFSSEEIDWILTRPIKTAGNVMQPGVLADFVIKTGYKDEPEIFVEGEPAGVRSTPLHSLAYNNKDFVSLVPKLFEIYHRLDVDYANRHGLTHLHVACANGCDDIVEKILESGVDPNCLTKRLIDSPLQIASRNNHKKTVELLLRHGANPNLTNAQGLTPIHTFCKNYDDEGMLELISELTIKKHQPVLFDIPDKLGIRPLHLAVLSSNRNVIEMLLRRGANSFFANDFGSTPLHFLCKRKLNEELVESFFEIVGDIKRERVDIDARDKYNWTPLHWALENGRKKDVASLLRQGANPSLVNSSGSTALHIVCKRKHDDDLAKLFFDINDEICRFVEIDATDSNGFTPLQYALYYRLKQVVELLIRRGADINLVDTRGYTPLHSLCQGKTDNEQLLDMFFEITKELRKMVEVDARDKNGRTPLYYALIGNKKKMAESLLRHGANIVAKDYYGRTCLHLICEGKVDGKQAAELIFEITKDHHQTIQIDPRDNFGNTPLHLSLSNGKKQIAEFLLRRCADPNAVNAYGFTPLHVIAQVNFDELELLDMFFSITDEQRQSVQIDARDKSDLTPLHFALCNGKQKKTELLLRRGANPNAVDDEGLTPLHFICNRKEDDDLSEIFFKINKELNQFVGVNVRDKLGRAPLHLAVARGLRKTCESLLRNGADPNFTNAKGLTPLHIICKSDRFDNFAKLFFDISKAVGRRVRVNIKDELGRTPLQYAVASLLPNTVREVLKHGVNLKIFVFPDPSYFATSVPQCLGVKDFKYILASGMMRVLQHLQKFGYRLHKKDISTLFKIFVDKLVTHESENIKSCLEMSEEYVRKVKGIMVGPKMTLYDLIQLKPEEAVDVITSNYR